MRFKVTIVLLSIIGCEHEDSQSVKKIGQKPILQEIITPTPLPTGAIPDGSLIECQSNGWGCRFPELTLDSNTYNNLMEYAVTYTYNCDGFYELALRTDTETMILKERGKDITIKIHGKGPLVFFDNTPTRTESYPLPENCNIYITSTQTNSI